MSSFPAHHLDYLRVNGAWHGSPPSALTAPPPLSHAHICVGHCPHGAGVQRGSGVSPNARHLAVLNRRLRQSQVRPVARLGRARTG